MYTFARIVVGAIYRVLFRFKVAGVENIPLYGGVILCANHRSYHDTVVLGLASPRDLHFLAKYELFKGRFFKGLFSKLGAIPINRENPGMDSLKRVVEVLKSGQAIGIFMQGGRRQQIEASDAKAGVALFAIKGRVPVVPVNISSKFKLFSKVNINIGEPISFEEFWDKKVRTADLNAIAQRVLDSITNLGNERR